MSLFPHESLQQIYDFEFLTYLKEGDPKKPLIVFFPGWAHLARIAYGGADIIPSKNSLAQAFHEEGYSFLAISYPLENKVYSTIYPQLKIKEWAQAAAVIVQSIFKRTPYPYLISIHWGAAGHLINRFKQTTQLLRLSHLFSISLEATPPLLIYHKLAQEAEILNNGLVSLSSHYYPMWMQQIEAMLGKSIDPKRYEELFLGAIPINLLGTSLVYQGGQIQDDIASSMEDRQSFNFAQSTLVVSISGNLQQAPYHPILDQMTWSHINIRKIYHSYLLPLFSQIQQLPDNQWHQLLILLEAFTKRAAYSVDGNHFFLINKSCTHQVVKVMQTAEKDIIEFRKALADLLKIHISRLN